MARAETNLGERRTPAPRPDPLYPASVDPHSSGVRAYAVPALGDLRRCSLRPPARAGQPWAPTEMPIERDPSDHEVPCGLPGHYYSVLSHGELEAV